MPRSRETGDGDEYTDTEEAALEAAAGAAMDEYEAEAAPTRMTVQGVVEWAGAVQASNGGVRRVRLDGLDLTEARDRLRTARDASQRAREAHPARSMTAKGWHSQLRALTSSRYGSDMADRAGLDPTARTLRAWLSEDRAPNKANQQRIAEAYGALRNRGLDSANERAKAARHEFQESLTDALRDRYGATIRFRNIEELSFED